MQQNNFIHETSVIYPNVIIEPDVYIGAFCIIGAPAESIRHWNDPEQQSVIIRSGAKIHGHVTIDAGTHRHTEIKSDTFIMKGCHIGHDAIIHSGVILSPHVLIGGHCEIGENTNMGMGSIVHHRVNIPDDCMIGMNSTVTKTSELWSHGVYIGTPAVFLRWNERNT